MNKFLAVPAALAALTFAACGSDKGTEKATTATTKAVAAPPKTYSAYDEELLSTVEGEIKEQMHVIARDNPGKEDQLTSHCIADGERNFTCESTLSLKFDEGGYTMCSSLEATQRGNVNPKTGDYTWKNTGTKSGDAYEC